MIPHSDSSSPAPADVGGKKQQRHITTINITQPAQKLGSQLAGLKVFTVQMLRGLYLSMHQNKALPNRSRLGIGHGNRSGATLDKSLDQH